MTEPKPSLCLSLSELPVAKCLCARRPCDGTVRTRPEAQALKPLCHCNMYHFPQNAEATACVGALASVGARASVGVKENVGAYYSCGSLPNVWELAKSVGAALSHPCHFLLFHTTVVILRTLVFR
jgi:hypothetical protein